MSLSIYQGDSTDILNITVEDETDYSQYTCKAMVVKSVGDVALITASPTIDTTNGVFVSLSPTDTAGLLPGTYIFLIVIKKTVNSVVTYRKEIHETLVVAITGF